MTSHHDNHAILTFNNLKVGYGKRSLMEPLSASAYTGELISVLGKNGVGKSTLLRTLAGIQNSLSGSIKLSGREKRDHSPAEFARNVGFLSTEMIRAGHMTVYELVSLGRYPHTNWLGTLTESDRNVIENALELTGLEGYSDRFINEISDGERQKSMIARILAQDTPLMIMDEPTAFLDIASKHEIMHLLHKLTRYTGKTIIYSTHDFSMALNQSDKMWLVTEDRLIEGAPEDLVLNGEFEHLFEAPHVRFEPETGNFVFKGEQNGQVYVCGNSAGRKWIERALLRAGILVTDNITDTYIDTGTANNTVWKLCRGDSQVVCTSVYDLINRLKQELR